MKIEVLIGIEDYKLMVYRSSERLYHFSIIDRENILHNFEGIYRNRESAIARGKSVMSYWRDRLKSSQKS